jgi:hypothetical protein
MTVRELVTKFITQPSYLDMGAGKLAGRFGCSKEAIYKAKEEARHHLHAAELADVNDIVARHEAVILRQTEELAKYVGSESTTDGSIRKFETARPLTPTEIKELAGVDEVTSYVARVWDKMLPNGKWTYSIDVRFRVKDFYNAEELKAKLEELMPDYSPWSPPVLLEKGPEALVILLADDHVGAVNLTDLYGASTMTYKERLLFILDEAKLLGKTFDEVHVLSLGDQLNGWNSQTTRGGHEVKSLSNKEQFDAYVEGRVFFYEGLFTSGLSDKYFVHDVENSNHSGLGFSYMANQTLKMWLSAKFPTVEQKSYHETIEKFEYGNHVIMFGHGKDEKFQKRPMPAVLDAKTDVYLYDLACNWRINPPDANVTFYKGDLHQHGLQCGKFGRYINVPAISGNSDYGDINYGNAKGGALLEILDRNSYRVTSQAIWFK